jgi:hypothetical protein
MVCNQIGAYCTPVAGVRERDGAVRTARDGDCEAVRQRGRHGFRVVDDCKAHAIHSLPRVQSVQTIASTHGCRVDEREVRARVRGAGGDDLERAVLEELGV